MPNSSGPYADSLLAVLLVHQVFLMCEDTLCCQTPQLFSRRVLWRYHDTLRPQLATLLAVYLVRVALLLCGVTQCSWTSSSFPGAASFHVFVSGLAYGRVTHIKTVVHVNLVVSTFGLGSLTAGDANCIKSSTLNLCVCGGRKKVTR